jgi:CRP-like cAMP-binding protein
MLPTARSTSTLGVLGTIRTTDHGPGWIFEMASFTALVHDRPFNDLLRGLNEQDYGLLDPHVEAVELRSGQVLYHPGEDVDTVYFPCGASSASFIIAIGDGRDVQTLVIGHEGAVGGIVSHGYTPAFSRIVVQLGGPFVQMSVRHLELAKGHSASLHRLFVRYAVCLLAQSFQSIACNAVHTIEQRAAKWLTAAIKRAGTHVVPVTHEQLALMLGVGRSYATRIISDFKAEEILETHRRSIVVRDPLALERKSCDCNMAVDNHFKELMLGVYSEHGSRHQ